MMVKRKLLDQVSDVARFRHLSLRTEEAYRNWIKRHSDGAGTSWPQRCTHNYDLHTCLESWRARSSQSAGCLNVIPGHSINSTLHRTGAERARCGTREIK